MHVQFSPSRFDSPKASLTNVAHSSSIFFACFFWRTVSEYSIDMTTLSVSGVTMVSIMMSSYIHNQQPGGMVELTSTNLKQVGDTQLLDRRGCSCRYNGYEVWNLCTRVNFPSIKLPIESTYIKRLQQSIALFL